MEALDQTSLRPFWNPSLQQSPHTYIPSRIQGYSQMVTIRENKNIHLCGMHLHCVVGSFGLGCEFDNRAPSTHSTYIISKNICYTSGIFSSTYLPILYDNIIKLIGKETCKFWYSIKGEVLTLNFVRWLLFWLKITIVFLSWQLKRGYHTPQEVGDPPSPHTMQ